jgi:hypothetical protein
MPLLVKIHDTWLIILAVSFIQFYNHLHFSTNIYTSTAIFYGVVFSLLLFFSVLIHDLAHRFAARITHKIIFPKKKNTFFLFGTDLNNIMFCSFKEMFLIMLTGPLANLLSAILLFSILHFYDKSNQVFAILLQKTASLNFILAGITLLPFRPFDGSVLVNHIIEKHLQNSEVLKKVLLYASKSLPVLLLFIALVVIFWGYVFSGIWIGILSGSIFEALKKPQYQSIIVKKLKSRSIDEFKSLDPENHKDGITLDSKATVYDAIKALVKHESTNIHLLDRNNNNCGTVTVDSFLSHLKNTFNHQPKNLCD